MLLQCDWLFEAGISSIFHCQSKAYYDCILSLAKMGAAENLKNLKPHRPAAEYKQMVKMQQEPGGGKANRSKGTDLLQEEEEPNFFCRPQEPQGDAQQHSQTSKTRRKKSRTAAAAAPSSGANAISCSDSDASDEQDGKAAVQEGPDLPPGAVAGSGNLLKAVAAASRFSAQAQAGKEKRKQRKVDEKKGDEDFKNDSHRKRRRTVPVKQEMEESLPPASLPPEVAEIEVIKSSSEDEDAVAGVYAGTGQHMEHSAAADSAGQADVSEETISGQNVDVSKTHLPACDPVLSLAASSPAEVSASSSSSKAAGPAVSAPAAASSSSSKAAGPAMPGSSERRSIEDDSAPRLEIPRQPAEQAPEPSSMFNMSTVWLGNIPIVKRMDKSSVPRISEGVGRWCNTLT